MLKEVSRFDIIYCLFDLMELIPFISPSILFPSVPGESYKERPIRQASGSLLQVVREGGRGVREAPLREGGVSGRLH